ncbi:MAG TPA: nucleotide exchange factor GrpE [Ruminiclostridium sp.]|nr:nucleotide exchange factor GrpE [Ruminiclostridium sp.]
MLRDHEKEIDKNEPPSSENKELQPDAGNFPQPDNENDNNAAEAPENNELKELLSKKEEETKELLERIQRLAAEYDNFRKRTQKEKDRLYGDALTEVVSKFLPVLDNLERALDSSASDETGGLREGITLVSKQFLEILAKLDVKPIEAVGADFNPELHNAVMHVKDENFDHNYVVEEFQKGYIYKDEIVIRYSMVKVAN